MFWSRNLSSEQEPEHALGDDLLAVGGGRELLLTIWDGQSVEADTLVIHVRNLTDSQHGVYVYLIRVKDRALPEKGLETPHTTNKIFYLG